MGRLKNKYKYYWNLIKKILPIISIQVLNDFTHLYLDYQKLSQTNTNTHVKMSLQHLNDNC